jgi:hypothetical protein
MDIEELIKAIDDYSDARQEHRKCVASCEYDAGYFCWRYEQARDKAHEHLTNTLNAYIDARIAAVLDAALEGK